MKKKWLTILLAMVISVCMIPMMASAEDEDCYITVHMNGHGNIEEYCLEGDTYNISVPYDRYRYVDLEGEGNLPSGGDLEDDLFVFAGWYSDAACQTSVNMNDYITSDGDIYAKWDPIYKVGTTGVTDQNCSDILGDGSISFDVESKTFRISKDIENTTSGPLFNLPDKDINLSIAKGVSITQNNGAPILYVKSVTINADENFTMDGGRGFVIGASESSITAGGDVTLTSAGSSTVIQASAVIDTTGDVSLTNTSTISGACSGLLKVLNAENVTVSANAGGSPLLGNGAEIKAAGNVELSSPSSFAVSGKADIKGNNISIISGSSAPAVTGDAVFDAAGDVTITSTSIATAIGGTLNISNANNVTIDSACNRCPVANTRTDINAAGNVDITAENGFIGTIVSIKAGNINLVAGGPSPVFGSSGNLTAKGDIKIMGNNEDIVTIGMPFTAEAADFTLYSKYTGAVAIPAKVDIKADNILIAAENATSLFGSEFSLSGRTPVEGIQCLVDLYTGDTEDSLALVEENHDGTVTDINGAKAVKMTSHFFKSEPLVKATFTKDGVTAGVKCADCGRILSGCVAIPAVKTCKVPATAKVYTGKAFKPAATVKDSNGKVLVKGTDYTVAYTNNTKVGKATAKVTLNGNYTGSKSFSFKINPKKATVKSAVPGKKLLKVTAGTKVAATGGTKYKIAYKVKGAKSWKYKTTKNKTLTIKSLKKGKRYQVKIQAIKTVNKVTYKGAWSAVKTTKKIK